MKGSDERFEICTHCRTAMKPVYAKEVDEKNNRWRIIVDYLVCPFCGEIQCVDDTFDGPWHQGQ